MDHVAGLDQLRLGQVVQDRRAGSASSDQTGRPQNGKMLARICHGAAEFAGQVTNRALAVPKDVQDHQSLWIGQHPAYLGMQSVPLPISVASIVH